MKVLFLVPYIYDHEHKEFTRNATGFGYMVADIIHGISSIDKVIMTSYPITKGYKQEYTVCRHTIIDIIAHIRLKDIVLGFYYMMILKAPFRNRLRYFYYYLNTGYFKYILNSEIPDVVHIHGLTYQTKPFINVCKMCKVPYIITLHGLNGLEPSTYAFEFDKKYEKKALAELHNNKIPVTVVSSGIKKSIYEKYHIPVDNIKVILNGIRFEKNTYMLQPKEKDSFNIVCVGNISKGKNQFQILRAYSLLPDYYQKKIKIKLFGNNNQNLPILKEIRKLKYSDNVVYEGYVERTELKKIWEWADLNIVASKSEGFGLSIIEGYLYGVPTLAFSDLDAISDLYSKDTMELVKERSDTALAEGIKKCVVRIWDKELIRKFSENFSLEAICLQYHNEYLNMINQSNY